MKISKNINDTNVVKIKLDEYKKLLKMAEINVDDIVDGGLNEKIYEIEEKIQNLIDNGINISYKFVGEDKYEVLYNDEKIKGTFSSSELSNYLDKLEEELKLESNVNANNNIEIFYKDGKIYKILASKKQLIQLGKKAGFI